MGKSILIGLAVYVIGIILVSATTAIYNGTPSELSYLRAISYAIIYLAGVVAASAVLFVKKRQK
ncbi:hypothetical protein BAG01nite_08030 [Brevibacillus agri]|uniref:Uncharacterized protein n=1 Tax=Brevibacillus agri TaxID=51101 RepID=A0A3M8BA41_9BACL|nr:MULTISPECIES: hypothetical protein [Brevibacillus]ELK39505.1 hypothetical protein D478_24283 [Brevibacillus agri BAB-2500]EJL39451.1 hypothetical protein PMI08_04963 [Brevibacillus sp. CF112]MBG9565805.1 hypothetical protein [Brevibacillus agri]MBY0053808.1 hypothetical protein [Brevibacillus agri]MCG5254762.1 hypothetical protein [Brevibacillus agri]